MIFNLKLDSKYDQRDVEQIFTELDTKSEGEIKFNDFIKILVEKSDKD